jgi:hypothetical protein
MGLLRIIALLRLRLTAPVQDGEEEVGATHDRPRRRRESRRRVDGASVAEQVLRQDDGEPAGSAGAQAGLEQAWASADVVILPAASLNTTPTVCAPSASFVVSIASRARPVSAGTVPSRGTRRSPLLPGHIDVGPPGSGEAHHALLGCGEGQ